MGNMAQNRLHGAISPEIVSRETCADLSFHAAAGTKRAWD